jgi:ribonucleoside-diphosphate reductase alpha chain
MDTESSTAPSNNGGISLEMSPFANGVYKSKYAMKGPDGTTEDWPETAYRVVSHVLGALDINPGTYEFDQLLKFVAERKFMPGGRYLYASGRELHQTQNCLLMRAEDSREGWAELGHNALMALQTGAGIGIDYSNVRASGEPIRKTGGVASGPLSLMKIINEIGRNVMQGGSRRSAIWAGLSWDHPDIFKFIHAKKWPEVVVKAKEQDFMFPADLDMTNISVLLDDAFFIAYNDEADHQYDLARRVYSEAVESMIQTAEPGLSVDIGDNAGETLRNACTEVTSSDDSDICNLGSINLARVESLDEMEELVKLGTLFLLAGTVYSHVPYDKVDEIRTKNRRLGLGIMGVHEWLLQRGKTYGEDVEFEDWLNVYETSTEYAEQWADQFGLSRPVKTRAIAPTGTIGIVAETTTGIEPIFCAAYKRRVREASPDGDVIRATYVIDPTAKRLLDSGVDPSKIEDAYVLSYDVERRIAFQSWVQQYVDHGISSTINLPYPITDPFEIEDFKQILMKYLPELRGVTAYPEGAISGQPITPVPLEWALQHQDEVVIETEEETCKGGVCGV